MKKQDILDLCRGPRGSICVSVQDSDLHASTLAALIADTSVDVWEQEGGILVALAGTHVVDGAKPQKPQKPVRVVE